MWLTTTTPGTTADPPSEDAELSQLRKLSADDSSEYWNGRRSKQLQARYAELLGDDGEEPEAEEPTAGRPAERNPAAETYKAIIDTMHPDDRDHFREEIIGNLSKEAVHAINAEWHRPDAMELTLSGPATAEEMHVVAQTLDGATLISEWGHEAPYRAAVVRERLARIIADFPDEDAVAFADALSVGESLAIARALARG